jgi:hypothetical protein
MEKARTVNEVGLSPMAIPVWTDMYYDLDRNEQKETVQIRPFLARAAPQILRMAMLVALADGFREILPVHLQVADKLWSYSRQSVEFMLNMGLSDLTPLEQTVFSVLEKSDTPLTSTQVVKICRMRRERVNAVLGCLTRKRMIAEKEDRNTGGRPRTLYYIR